MSYNTGNHYKNVAAQMNAYVNSPMQRYGGPVQGGVNSASQYLRYGAQQMGVNPAIVNGIGGFARNFMRNVLS